MASGIIKYLVFFCKIPPSILPAKQFPFILPCDVWYTLDNVILNGLFKSFGVIFNLSIHYLTLTYDNIY